MTIFHPDSLCGLCEQPFSGHLEKDGEWTGYFCFSLDQIAKREGTPGIFQPTDNLTAIEILAKKKNLI